MINQKHHISRLGRGGRDARTHGAPNVGGCKGGRIVHAIAHHHYRAGLAFTQNQKHVLVRCEFGPDSIKC
jgi:hypothetical protein